MVNGIRFDRNLAAVGRHGGWVLLALLFILAALGTGMAAVGTVWTTAAQREKETELLFVGEQYRRAIESYRRRGPGAEKPYPASLEDLLEDRRFPMPVRHLRRLYPDPITGRTEWGLVRDGQGGIIAVYSLSEGRPIKQSGFAAAQEGFEAASSYREWVFRARVAEQPAAGTEAGEAVPAQLARRPSPPRSANVGASVAP